ncbi:MAG TPA: hypothetical protein VIY73_00520 [Polyangiaceae bacterium]
MASASATPATTSSTRSRLVTAWSMLARLALNEIRVPSARNSSRVSSDPWVWIVEPPLPVVVA